jgi:hypothetical protein
MVLLQVPNQSFMIAYVHVLIPPLRV